MVYGLDPSIVRYVMRKVRKESGYRQEDIADATMSYGTISNIERGVGNVDEKTVLKYLAKLGLNEATLKNIVKKELERMEELTFELQLIELMLDNNKLGTHAEQMLKTIGIERYHPLAPFYTYLEGRCFQAKKAYDKAEKHYKFAIRLHNQYKLLSKDNIVSICYNELSICCYVQNKIDKALHYVEKGLAEYVEHEGSEDRRDIKAPMLNNKALYLLNLSQYEAAKQIIDDMWAKRFEIRSSYYTLLNIYKYRAMLLRKMQKYAEAIEICKEGIHLGFRNNIQNRYLDIMNILGSIYLLQKQLDKAEHYFQMVLNHDYEGNHPRSRTDALTYLAIIYAHEKDWAKAEGHIQRALDVARSNYRNRLSKVLIVAGNIYAEQQNFTLAIPCYQEAEQLSLKDGLKKRQYTALLQLAKCFDSMEAENEWKVTIKKVMNLQQELNLQSEEEVYAI
ncbi:tetratricopeptide repeat protein [Laceyella putida]|uniref:Tetratricopeptide repeat protein n=1 Tax=Laceyella putida TaxID=110101 RepID=A0ABW2RIN2_9BACL